MSRSTVAESYLSGAYLITDGQMSIYSSVFNFLRRDSGRSLARFTILLVDATRDLLANISTNRYNFPRLPCLNTGLSSAELHVPSGKAVIITPRANVYYFTSLGLGTTGSVRKLPKPLRLPKLETGRLAIQSNRHLAPLMLTTPTARLLRAHVNCF